ncbi:uncharacterized protein METZ01_LOCUS15567, partial [marine metagenome]
VDPRNAADEKLVILRPEVRLIEVHSE